ncbi:circadian clock-controlled protein daywake-like [Glossina fuscipes]|uniref:Circadian clock-controlled protein daywake-like n=1 Tax=Glossina fuscipes TaxID=7396 RepID=A0A9C6DM91_9MUSC|nr:circadian clock-controlled protein daywake-like [Glossina fuscipes]
MCKQDSRSTIFLILCGLSYIFASDLPPEIQKCKTGDHACITQRINEVIRLYPKGNPTFGLDDFSLIKLNKISAAKKSSNSPVQLNFILSNLELRGIEKLTMFSSKGFVKDIKNIELDFNIPLLRINSLYELDGKLLLLPIKGKGNVEVILHDAHFVVTINVELEKRQGKNYIKFKKLVAKVEPKSTTFKFENLFDGNKELTDATNKVLTDSWQDVWNELGKDFNQGFADALYLILTPVADSISYDDYFAD